MKEVLLQIKDLSVTFSSPFHPTVHAVEDLILDIYKGESLAIVGESGSGKSITSLSIMGLLPSLGKVSNGSITFDKQSLNHLTEKQFQTIRGRRIAMIFQDPMTSLNPLTKVGKQIAEPIHVHQRVSWKDAYQMTHELLAKVALEPSSEFFNKYPHQLSGGQQQRIMIAMAISSQPDLLIADEPTTALDVTIQKQVIDLLIDIQKEYGMSLLFITHDLALVGNIADRIAVMRNGKLVEIGKKDDILRNPQNPYTKGLIACRPPMNTKPRRLPTIDNFLDHSDNTPQNEPRLENEFSQCSDILTVEDVSLDYGKRELLPWRSHKPNLAVNHVNLKIPGGRRFGIVGESGCGKTSLARVIAGLIPPSKGRVIFKGQDINKLNHQARHRLRRKIQYIFQNPYAALNPRFTIEQTLCEPMEIHGIGDTRKDRHEMASELIEQVGLKASWLTRYPHEFSGGQRQRICIARALTLNPELIICDESVSALDVSIQAQILNLLLDLQEKFQMTYIFISHDLAVVKFFCDDMAVMKNGSIVEEGSADQIYKSPKNIFTKTLLASIPQLH